MIRRKRLGTRLLEAGLLNQEQLDQALLAHEKSGLPLGQYLIREGIVGESEVIDVLCRQLRLDRYRPDRYPVDRALAALIPAKLADQHGCVPLIRKSRLLLLAMTDPMDIDTLDAIELRTSLEVEPVICSEQELNQLFSSMYGMRTTLNGDPVKRAQVRVDCSRETTAEATVEHVQVASLQDLAENAPATRLVHSILARAVRQGAGDIHLSPEQKGVSLRFRIDGKLHEMPAPPESMMRPIVSRIKTMAGLDVSVVRIPQHGRFTITIDARDISVHASTLPTIHGENVVLRPSNMNSAPLPLDRLGMIGSDRVKIEKAVQQPRGLILAAGPTGSGKTTSLYSILRRINTPDVNIITLEDPVEARIDRIRQVQLDRKAGLTFAGGLRAILRQDPDVILAAEIRDPDTASIAVRAALSGCRVLGGIHTDDAAGAITRLIGMGIEPFLIASVLLVSFAQRLIRTNCPHCKQPYVPSRQALERFGITNPEGAEFQRGKGCFNCLNTGYKGRTGIFEVLAVDRPVREMILARRSAREIAQTAKGNGRLRTLKEDAADKIMRGTTTFEEAATAVFL